MSIQTRVVTITPQMAHELLERNTYNRPPKGSAVKRYATDMREGRWLLTGEPIIESEEGVLLNGQNRLLACIEAGAPFKTLYVDGVEPGALDAIDIGQARTLADQLHWRGVSNSATVAAATKWVWRYDDMVKHKRAQMGYVVPPRDEELRFFDEYRDYFDAAAATIISERRRIPGAQSVSMFNHVLIARIRSVDVADNFYRDVAYESEGDNAAVMLKDWLLSHQTIGTRPPVITTAAIHVKAARFWLNDETPGRLLWKRHGNPSYSEAFPRIDGPLFLRRTAEPVEESTETPAA